MNLSIQSVLQEAQERGTPDEFATALVVFFVEVNGRCFAGCCRVKQAVGGEYGDAPLEISSPVEYHGPDVDYGKCRSLIETAYREAVANMPDVNVYVCNVFHFHGRVEAL